MLSLATKTLSCFPSCGRIISFIFKKKCLPDTSVRKTIVSLRVIFSGQNSILWKERLVQPHSNNHCNILPGDVHRTEGYNRNDICVLHISSLTIFSKPVFKGLDLIKLIIFAASSRAFLSETGIFSPECEAERDAVIVYSLESLPSFTLRH